MMRSSRVLACALVLACTPSPAERSPEPQAVCAPAAARPGLPPGVAEPLTRARYWLDRLPPGEAERVLMDEARIRALNAANMASDHGFRDILDPALAAPAEIARKLAERVAWIRERVSSGKYLEVVPGSFERSIETQGTAVAMDEVRVVAAEADLRCVPTEHGFFTPPLDLAFDRNQCSGLHPGELVRVLRATPDGLWRYVHAGHSTGWLRGASLSPALAAEAALAFRDPPRRLVVTGDRVATELSSGAAGPALRLGTSLPIRGREPDGHWVVTVPTPQGLDAARVGAVGVHEGWLPFSRAAVFELAFTQLHAPYGWGDRAGERDCSRYLLDLFGVFGIRLPRHSAAQVQGAAERVVLDGKSEPDRLARLAQAGREGVVLLYFPGHIMLYLGEDGGKPFAISAIAEYLEPCPSGGHTVVKLERVVVTDLELGRRTERTAYAERMSELGVFR